MQDQRGRRRFIMTVIVIVTVMRVIMGKRGRGIWMNRLDLMRLSFWFTCESL